MRYWALLLGFFFGEIYFRVTGWVACDNVKHVICWKLLKKAPEASMITFEQL